MAACALALLAIAACSDSTDEPPSPTPQSVIPATPPAAASTGADDQPDPGIVVQLDSTSTPYPTATPLATVTPYPTATPYPTPPLIPGSATGPTVSIEIPPKADLKYPEVGSRLNDIVSRVEAGEISAEEAANEAPIHRGDSVGVTILLSGNVDGVVRFLEDNDGANIRAGGDYIEAYVPVLVLVETSQQPGVLQVRLIQPPGETQGTSQVVGNGPAVHGSPSWNQAGYTGRGIKVGVIDVGFWGLDDLLGTELPAIVQARCYTDVGQQTRNLSDCGNGDTHGTEVSESVMDIAPEVSLYISDPQSKADLRDAVDWMIEEGVSVINHSALWGFDGPGDGTSSFSISPLNTIDTAVDAGIVWVNAAGNQARGTWFKRNPDFTPVSGETYKLLRFSASNTINAQSYIDGPLELRWEDEWGRAETDLDLLVYKQGTNVPWLGSIDPQSGENGHYPYEYVSGGGAVDILIVHYGGPDPDWIQLVGWRGTRLALNSSGAGSTINPAESANPGMLAVGAAPWGDVNSIEGYSSRGPTPDGRFKPDVVGAACGETATGSRPFCGTSQAAPHVAGMAALVRQRFPDYTPAQVVSYLKESAQQRISSPDPNNTWGHGFMILPPVAGTTVATAPAAPTALTATANGHTQINLSWTAPSDNGGAAISGYLIEVSTNGSTWSDLVVNTRSTSTSYTHSGLTAGNTRHYRVSAINSVGTGPASNVDNATTGAAPASDLVVDTPTVDTSAPAAGARFTLSAMVRNQGNGSSAFTTLRYYRSTDSTITTGDTEVGTDSVSRLDAAESGDESISLTAPSTPGAYYYGACADAVTGESDTTNNCSTAVTVTVGAAPAPDLVVDTPTVDASAPAAGARFTLNATVRNQGNGPSASTTLRYYQSRDSTITAGDTEVGTDSVSRLDAAESGDESISVTAPSTPGAYYYGACVETVTDESDTTNNCSAAVTVTVGAAPAPDLVVDTPTVSGSAPAAGESFTLNATVRNQGAARSTSTTLRYYQSTDSTITTGDTEVGTDSVFGLNISASGAESVSLTAPSTAGTYYYGACVDALSDEADTTNNCSTAVVVVVGAAPAPDLLVDTPTVDTSAPAAGARFTLNATVRNQGNGPSASTTLRYYQSSDSTITAGDTEVGTDSVFRLDAAESGDESIVLTAPSTLGAYYYGACVETVTDESDTTNNCSTAVTVTVGAARAPDLVVDTPTVSGSAPAAGARFTLNATVRNQGSGRSGFTTLRYYRSTDSSVTGSDTSVGTDSVSGLNSSGSGDESIVLTAPSTPGTYYYGACVETVTGESDTTNNCSTAVTVTVGAAPAPDLVVDTPTVDTSAPAAGARFTLSAMVRNQGNGSSAFTTLRYYRSTDSTITTGDTEVGTDSVFRLDAAESGDESIVLTAPSTPGTYYYGACVGAVTGESDTTNNCSTAVTVVVGAAPAPDLVVDTPTVEASAPAAGASFTLSAMVRNQGNGSSAFTTLRYYRSTDSTITTGDTEVGTDSVFRLDASESGDESISLTAPSTPGTYYYGACVGAVTGESDTTNNCTTAVTVVVGAAPAPDLVVDTPTVDASAPAAGASFTLSAMVRNQGNGSSAFTTLRYYRSTDSTITTGDTEVGTDLVSRLDAAESGDESISVTAPSTPGAYYYGACVGAVTGESDTTNNCSTAVTVVVGAAPAPDLVVDTPTVDASAPAAGARFTLSAMVRNQGNGSSAFTTLRYYRSTDSTITTGDTEVGTDSVSRLDAAESGDESVSLTAPSTAGTYYYGACVETVTDESDTTNNCSTAVTVVVGAAPAPDLVVDTPTVDTSAPAAGARFTLSAMVRNQGNGSSAFTTLRYYRSTDSTITTGDTEVGTDSVSRLDAAESGDESISLTAPSTPGAYYYGACADAVTGESDTTNNCSTAVTVTVGAAPAPDLVVDTPTVDASAPAAGARFTLNATVRNQGNGPSASTTLRYYQSRDSTITAGDTEVGTDSVSRLDAAESGDESISVTAPSTPGAYYYGACVETVTDESDTTNNCSAAVTVTVGAAPAPDLVVSTFTVDNSNPVTGQYFTLNATVNNQGNGSSSSTTLRYYRSTDATITPSDARIPLAGIPGLSLCGGSEPFRQRSQLRPNPCAVHTRHLLLRRVCGDGYRGVRYDEQLLSSGDCNGTENKSASSAYRGCRRQGRGIGGIIYSGSFRALH